MTMRASTDGLNPGDIIYIKTAAPRPAKVKVKHIHSGTDLDITFTDARGGTAAIHVDLIYADTSAAAKTHAKYEARNL